MTKTVLIVLAALIGIAIGAVLAMASTKPNTFRVQRAATIAAPPEKVFALINDFREWSRWSPWEKKDPSMTRTYGGSAAGVGATYAWEGDKNVGKGGMEIVESTHASKIGLKLDFEKPFEAHNRVDFTLTPQVGGTHVDWAMHGPATFMTKIIQVFMNMDKMVGKDFEAGLADMKKAAEA